MIIAFFPLIKLSAEKFYSIVSSTRYQVCFNIFCKDAVATAVSIAFIQRAVNEVHVFDNCFTKPLLDFTHAGTL